MDDILELIKTRRNIKRFLPKYVSWEKISRMIDAARHAPSCGNVQNWKFLVVFDPSIKEKVAAAAYEQYELVQAPILIVVCGEPDKAERYYGLRGERLYTVQNCAAAIQNMLLEAHSLGLGTRWIGGFDEEAIKSMFKIPSDVRPQAIIAVGYAAEVPQRPPKYPLETIIYFHGWRARMRDPAKYMHDTATIIMRKTAAVQDSLQRAASITVNKLKKKAKDIKEKVKEKR
jgi:nitroreductase